MKINCSQKHDLIHIVFREADEVRNEKYNDDIIFDVERSDEIVGLEILDESHYLDPKKFLK